MKLTHKLWRKVIIMNIKKNRRLLVCFAVTLLVCLVIVVWRFFFLIPGDEIGYSILSLYIFFPLTSLVTGLILGIKKTPLQWYYIIWVGILGGLMPFIVFNAPSFMIGLLGVIAASAGISIGLLIFSFRSKKHD